MTITANPLLDTAGLPRFETIRPEHIAPALDACDVEASAPLDLQGVATGTLPNEIDAAKAVDDCKRATGRFPDVARFQYELVDQI